MSQVRYSNVTPDVTSDAKAHRIFRYVTSSITLLLDDVTFDVDIHNLISDVDVRSFSRSLEFEFGVWIGLLLLTC
jgi:hypothetical protein